MDTVSYHKLFDILKQYQNEANEIRVEKLARNANPLALVVVAQHYPEYHNQAPKPHKPHVPSSRQITSSKSHATTKSKGKEIQKSLALIAKHFKNIYKPTKNNLRTSSNTKNKNKDTSLWNRNDNQTRQFVNQRTVIVVGARETIWNQVVQQTWIQCFNYKGFGHMAKECKKLMRVKDYVYHNTLHVHGKDSESGPSFDVEPLEQVHIEDDYNVLANERQHSEQSESINDTYVVEKFDSNVIPDSSDMCDNEGKADQNAKEYEAERVVLANLIANLKLDTDEKKDSKQKKKANASRAHELKECKSALEASKDIRDRCRSALHHQEIELEKYKTYKDCTIEKDEAEHKLKETLDLEYVQSLEKEVNELEYEKADVSNEYDLLLQEKIEECESLAIELSKQTENVSKEVYIELFNFFAKLEKRSISLELSLQQCQE
ncbi:hypothetical protein Tco_0794120 [Tanacetum coccineum]